MHTEYFLLDEGGYRHSIEAIYEKFPYFEWIFAFTWVITKNTLVVKAIEFVDFGGFMISSQQEEILRVFNFVSH